MSRCTVTVTLRPDILDPQGKAILHALHSLGHDMVRDVRVGKVITLDLDEARSEAMESRVQEMSEALLANPVIENFSIEWHE